MLAPFKEVVPVYTCAVDSRVLEATSLSVPLRPTARGTCRADRFAHAQSLMRAILALCVSIGCMHGAASIGFAQSPVEPEETEAHDPSVETENGDAEADGEEMNGDEEAAPQRGDIEAASVAMSSAIEGFLEANDGWKWLSFRILKTEAWRIIATLLTILLVLVTRRLIMNVVMRWLRYATKKTKNTIDAHLVEALDPPLGYFVGALGVYVSILWLQLPDAASDFVRATYRIIAVLIVGWGLLRCTEVLTRVLASLAERTETELDDHLVPLVGRVIRVVVVSMIIILIVQEFGFNIAGLLAGLGVGGLAFALAAQDTLANWFGAMMIYTDRPFDIGDWIKTSELEGVVEEIGLRSTCIRTFSQTVVSVPNRNLANITIENFSRMPIRRVSYELGVSYHTTPAMMREALERIKDILRNHPEVDQNFWIVRFTDFADSSLNIRIYYFTTTTRWDRYLGIREHINLTIMQQLQEIGVTIAFPTRSIYMEKVDPEEVSAYDKRAKELFEARNAGELDADGKTATATSADWGETDG